MEYVICEKKENIAYIKLNRPEKRNALNPQLIKELKEALNKAEFDKDIKIIILKAQGEAFCAGADLEYLKTLQNNSFEENLLDSNNLMELYKKIYFHKKIIIAQIQGHAIAGGAGLATVCDFSFAIPEAKYGYSETSIGFVPAIVSIFLIRKIGEAKAKELLLTGKIISAKQAVKYGIFNFISKNNEIENDVFNFAKNIIINNSSQSIEITKKLIASVQGLNTEDALKKASKINAKSRGTSDCKKGVDAFLNKQKINWI